MVLEYSEICKILPQGYPMVLVDRVAALDPGVSIVAMKAVTSSEPCYSNLSKDLPRDRYAYPVSLLLESFGQSAAILWLISASIDSAHSESVLMLAVARECRIRSRAFPGEVLQHRIELENTIGDHVFVRGDTWVDDRVIMCVGSMLAVRRSRAVVLDHATSKGRESLCANSI